MLWNVINTILGAVALGIAIWGLVYGRRQFELSKRQDEEAHKRAGEDEEWARKFAKVATNLTSIGNKIVSTPRHGYGYDLVFHEAGLRNRIQAHLINLNAANRSIQIRLLSTDQLRHREVRQTIDDALRAIDEAKREMPQTVKVLEMP